MKKNQLASVLLALFSVAASHAQTQPPSANVEGAWRGTVSFGFDKDSGPVADAATTTAIDLSIDNVGAVKVWANNCRFTGEAKINPRKAGETLFDLQANDCRDRRFNGKYAGTLRPLPEDKAEVRLTSIRPMRMEVARIAGTASKVGAGEARTQ